MRKMRPPKKSVLTQARVGWYGSTSHGCPNWQTDSCASCHSCRKTAIFPFKLKTILPLSICKNVHAVKLANLHFFRKIIAATFFFTHCHEPYAWPARPRFSTAHNSWQAEFTVANMLKCRTNNTGSDSSIFAVTECVCPTAIVWPTMQTLNVINRRPVIRQPVCLRACITSP